MQSSVYTFVALVSNCNDFEHKAHTISVKMSEGVNLLLISLWVQMVDLGRNPVVRLFFELDLLCFTKSRGPSAGSSALSLGWFLGSGWGATRATLYLGSLGYNRLHPGLLIVTSPRRVWFKRWMLWIWLGDGFQDTHIGPVNPDLYFAAPSITLCTSFLRIRLISGSGLAASFLVGGAW